MNEQTLKTDSAAEATASQTHTFVHPVAYKTTRVLPDPGAEYADEGRMFQGIPGIERAANGRLWATWYGGGVTEDRHNYVMLATSDDDGQTWSKVKLVIDPDGPGPMRAFDPCLWHDPQGRMWLFWNQKLCNRQNEFSEEQQRSWYVWGMCTHNSGSENPDWSEPRRLCEAIMMNKPTVLSTGEWLLCSSDWFWDWSARVFQSTNQGDRWTHWGRAHVPEKTDRSFDEHMVVERRDGSLWMLIRTRYGIGESFSTDGGRTWGYVRPSAIAHVSARFFIRRLKSGNLILVKHGTAVDQKTEKRSHLAAFLSCDDGKTWQGGLVLDEREGVSYPDGVEGDDGTIYVVYDFDRGGAKEILLSRITERDILDGRLGAERSRLRMLINKAIGLKPSA